MFKRWSGELFGTGVHTLSVEQHFCTHLPLAYGVSDVLGYKDSTSIRSAVYAGRST